MASHNAHVTVLRVLVVILYIAAFASLGYFWCAPCGARCELMVVTGR